MSVLPSDVLWQHHDLRSRLTNGQTRSFVNTVFEHRAHTKGDLAAAVFGHLSEARTFHVADKVVKRLEAVVADQDEHVTVLDRMPPCAYGFCVLDVPISWLDTKGRREIVHAFTWGPLDSTAGRGVFVSMWADANREVDEVSQATLEEIGGGGASNRAALAKVMGSWWPVSAFMLPGNQPLGAKTRLLDDLEDAVVDKERQRAATASAGSAPDPGAGFWARQQPDDSTPAQAVVVGRAASGPAVSAGFGSLSSPVNPPGAQRLTAYEAFVQDMSGPAGGRLLKGPEGPRTFGRTFELVPGSEEHRAANERLDRARGRRELDGNMIDSPSKNRQDVDNIANAIEADAAELRERALAGDKEAEQALVEKAGWWTDKPSFTTERERFTNEFADNVKRLATTQEVMSRMVYDSTTGFSAASWSPGIFPWGPPGPVVNASIMNVAHRIVAIWHLMDQTYVPDPPTEHQKVEAARGLRKKLAREGLAPEVTVIVLRRAKRVPSGSGALAAEGTVAREREFRWPVGGHWRTLHRGTPQERQTWVSGHIKGPEGKPLRDPGRVYDLRR